MSEYLDRLNTPYVYDGDRGFTGIDTFTEIDLIQRGIAAFGQNIRMTNDDHKNVVMARKGLDFLAGLSGISPSYTYSEGDEQCFGFGVYSEPDDDKKDWLVAATKQAAIIWDGTTPYYVNYYSDTATAANVNTGTEKITITSHKFQVGDAVQVTTTDTLPGGISAATTYYVIDSGTNDIQLASSYDNALASTAINLTSQGVGTHTFQSIVDTSHDVEVRQVFNEVYIMRYKGRPLVWDGATAATGSVVNTEFESLDSAATLRGGGGPSGDPFPSTNTTAYIANRLIGVQPRSIATPTQGVTDSSTVILTDLLESNHVTPVNSEWYINEGSADYVVGFAPYQENNMLIFNRRSVVMASNAHDTENSVRYLVTNRYGCVAKKTIVNAGNNIFFLSDEGVMQLNPALDAVTQAGAAVSKVQGSIIPISRPIQDRITYYLNQADIEDICCAAVYDNKYYLAIHQNQIATGYTAVFVYDLILGNWVGEDLYPYKINELPIMPYTDPLDSDLKQDRLFAGCREGWFLMEENAGADDRNREIGDSVTTDTLSYTPTIRSRGYTFDTDENKRLYTVEAGVRVANGSSVVIKLKTFEPDTTIETIKSYTNSSGQEKQVVLRPRVRKRGHNFQVTAEITGTADVRYIRLKGSYNNFGTKDID